MKVGQGRRVDEMLARVIAHPLRVQALAVLSERAASPKELAAELRVPVGNVSYHVRELEHLGLIELVEERKRRGAIEHFYRAVVRPQPSAREWQGLSPEQRQEFSAWTLQRLLADATAALAAGTFDARPDRRLSRMPLQLDEQGWRELTAIQAEAEAAIRLVQEASAARLRADEAEGFPAVASLSCFELPPRPA